MVLNLLAINCWASEKSPLAPEKSASTSSQSASSDPQLIKIAQLQVTIYRDRCPLGSQPPQYDPVAWAAIINKLQAFEQGTFSLSALQDTVNFMVQTSIPAQGIWGAAPVTYITDSEMIDGPKK